MPPNLVPFGSLSSASFPLPWLSEEKLMPCLDSDYRNMASSPVPSFSFPRPWWPLNEKELPDHLPLPTLDRLHKVHALLQARSQFYQIPGPEALHIYIFNYTGQRSTTGQGHALKHNVTSSPSCVTGAAD